MKRIYLLMSVALSLMSVHQAGAQSIWPSIINSAGGSKVLSGVTHEWSVGEMTLVNTFATSSIVVTQGVLQTNLKDGTNAVEESPLGDLIQVFPNPANTYVNINFNAPGNGSLVCRLIDITGKVLSEQTLVVRQGMNSGKIDMSALAAATYMLQVTSNTENGTDAAISFKIQKLQ
jgi:opacity protein-like surface antigen